MQRIMFVFSIFLGFVIQSVIGDISGVERCRPDGSRWTFNDTIYYALEYKNELYAYPFCTTGFIISSTVKVRCVNGWWESPLPRCDRITSQQCERLTIGNRMIRRCEQGAPAVGKTCKFRCREEYELIGSPNRRCLPNLKWSGTQPRCVTLEGIPKKSISSFNYSRIATSAPKNTHLVENPPTRNASPNNPCAENNGGCAHKCDFQNGSIRCSCYNGYRLENGTRCKEIKATSVITGNNYHRVTYPTTDNTNPQRRIPIDPCKTNNGGCHQICTSFSGFASCSCNNGYILLPNGTCTDIDECLEGRYACTQICHNTVGGYNCSCRGGFILERGYECREIKRTPVITGDNSHRVIYPSRENTNPQRRIPIDPCKTNNGGCHQICTSSSGFASCSCNNGYILLPNGTCTDVDECIDRRLNLCNHRCNNFPGSFRCSCEQGFYLIDEYNCEDIDECQEKDLNLCNQHCHNTKGSYNCSCDPGYVLKNKHECEGCRKGSYRPEGEIYCRECPPNSFTDSEAKSSLSDCICAPGFTGDLSSNKPCVDINECEVNNFDCSNTCVNTPGSVHCSCPIGFELQGDNKTCVDIDECEIKNGGCQMSCSNSIGNFSCYCSNGYFLSKDGYSCDDADECAVNNGGCSDICINFPSGYYCSCPKGYRLDVEGKTCIAVRCILPAVPHHSTMRCFPKSNQTNKVIIKPNDDSASAPDDYPVDTVCRIKCYKGYNLSSLYDTVECMDNGNWSSATPNCIVSNCVPLVAPENGDVYPPICTEGPISVKQQCYFTCKAGYHLTQKRQMIKCKNNLQWSANTQPSCEADEIVPVINCPDDITIELKTNESWANVTIPEPVTNMKSIEIFPDWISIREPIIFPSGKTDILFKAGDDSSNAIAACILTVNVVDKEPPSFVQCPDSITVDGIGSLGTIVEWEEPFAVDNVGIKSISRNLEPNSRLPAGIHRVEYMATDDAGNIARCSFEIDVSRGHCGDLEDPANGKANCMDWLLGKLCRPSCESGYIRDPDAPKFFACGDTKVWTPSDVISPCLPECVNGTIWSPITEFCEEVDISNFTTTT